MKWTQILQFATALLSLIAAALTLWAHLPS